MAPSAFRLSVVAPLKDEAANIETLCLRIRAVLEPLTTDWELILVDDGCRDETYELACGLHRADPAPRRSSERR
jgi:hypothetical protein